MSIPMPKAGHWQKLKFGKKISQPPLPLNYMGNNEVTLTLLDEGEENSASNLSPLKFLQREIEANLKPYLKVPEKLSNPDKLIIATREGLNRNERYEHNGIISCYRGELDIRAAKTNIPRALRFMDTLIKLFQVREHNVFVDNSSTYVMVKTQKFEISLREKNKRIPGNERWQTSNYLPTGVLVFKINRLFHTKEWKDGKLKLEDQLSSILAKLEIVSDELNAEALIREKEKEIRQQQEFLQKEFEKRQEKDLAAFKETLQKAERWHKAVNLRNFIDAVEQKTIAENGSSEDLVNWLEWARKKADWYDPFIEREDELLKNVDKTVLQI